MQFCCSMDLKQCVESGINYKLRYYYNKLCVQDLDFQTYLRKPQVKLVCKCIPHLCRCYFSWKSMFSSYHNLVAFLVSVNKQCIWRYLVLLSLRAKHFACSTQMRPFKPDKVMHVVQRPKTRNARLTADSFKL